MKTSKLAQAALNKPLQGGTWKPLKEGDVVEGEVADIGEVQGKFGPQLTVSLKNGDGLVMVYANDCLKREITQNKVKPGDRIAIAYRGNVKTGRGRPFRLFSVAVAR